MLSGRGRRHWLREVQGGAQLDSNADLDAPSSVGIATLELLTAFLYSELKLVPDELAKAVEYDVVLTDLKMPTWTGSA